VTVLVIWVSAVALKFSYADQLFKHARRAELLPVTGTITDAVVTFTEGVDAEVVIAGSDTSVDVAVAFTESVDAEVVMAFSGTSVDVVVVFV